MATVTGMTADATNAALATKVDKTTSVLAGTGLSGGGDLSSGRTLAVIYGTTAGTALQGNDGRVPGALQASNNLTDLASASAARSNLNLSQRLYFDTRDFGSVGDGVADDTSAINAAITAAATAGGGTVYIPHGTYKTTGSIVIYVDNVVVRGENRGATIIKPATGSTFDVVKTPIPAIEGSAGYIRNFIGVESMTLDCTQMTSTVAGAGNGIHFYGVRYSHIRDVNIVGCLNYGIILDGDITNFSYSVDVEFCRVINGGGGLLAAFSEEAFVNRCNLLQANLALGSAQPSFSAPDAVGYIIRLKSGYFLIAENVIGSSGTHTSAAIQVENSGPTRIIGNRFDHPRYQAIRTTAGNNLIEANQIGNPSSIGSVEGIKLGSSNNVVIGNIFDNTNGAAHYTYCISEPTNESNNTIIGNRVLPGTVGTINVNAASTGNRVANNVGYNPVGHITAPGMPATTVAYTNNFGSDATVYINGGTVTNVTIGGTNLGFVPAMVRVSAGQTIALIYSSVPTWTWFLD